MPFKEFIFIELFMLKIHLKELIFKQQKKAFFLSFLIICCFILNSCNQKEELIKQPSCAINSLAIAVNDQLWSGEIGDSLRKKFAAPVDGLPQEEPLFTI